MRRDLWIELDDLQHNYKAPWCFIGYFNAILGAHEHRGKDLPSRISCEEFRSWSDLAEVIHVNTRRSFFTWSNGRHGSNFTEKRLNRTICNEDWISFWISIDCSTLTHNKSDHFPILLNLSNDNSKHASSFKFLKMWSKHPGCIDITRDAWQTPVFGCPMYILFQNLKILKGRLKEWNKNVICDVNNNVAPGLSRVDQIQQQINDYGGSDIPF